MLDPASVVLGGVLGGIVGWQAGRDAKGRNILEQVKVNKPPFYRIITLDMATARTDEKWDEVADFIIIDNQDASVACEIRLNEPDFEKLDLRDYSRLQGTIWRFFITNAAGSGSIKLLLCRGLAFTAEKTKAGEETLIPFYTMRSDKDTHFTGSIAQNAVEEESLTGLISNKVRITGIIILSDQELAYRVILYSTDAFADADLDVDSLINEFEFDLPGYGRRIAGTGKYSMVVTDLDMDYIDEDGTKELHVALQNLSSTSKNAGATGEVVLRFIYEERD